MLMGIQYLTGITNLKKIFSTEVPIFLPISPIFPKMNILKMKIDNIEIKGKLPSL